MKKLYGDQYIWRYQEIAKLIPPNTSVLELCAGDGFLYENYLREKVSNYTAVEWNIKFSLYLRELGANVIQNDLKELDLPKADIVLMHASLYQFENYPEILNRMFEAANNCMIVAEPVNNVASSNSKLKSTIAAHLTNPGDGPKRFRFTKETLTEAFDQFPNKEIIHPKQSKEMLVIVKKG